VLVSDGFLIQLGKIVLLLALVLAPLLTISFSNSNSQPPSNDWLEFCPYQQLCFQRPTDLIPVEVVIIDSLAGQLESENINLTYDLGQYSATFDELTYAHTEAIVIDGHHGKLFIQDNKMALSVPNILGKTGFTMLINFKNSSEFAQGRRIFQSVKFNLKY